MASTRSYGGDGTPVGEQSLGELVATATRDLSVLIHQEMELAKAELAEQAKKGAVGAGLLGAAGVLAMLGVLLLCFSVSFAIAEGGGVPVWAGFLCVGGLFAIVGGVVGFLGAVALKTMRGPDQTVTTLKSALASIRRRRTSEPPVS